MDDEPPGRPLGRRAFLGLVGLGLSGVAWGEAAVRTASQATDVLPATLRNAVPFGGGWRIYSVNPPYPRFDRATWRLGLGGLAGKPQSLSYEDLLDLRRIDEVSDFHCVTGWSVEDVRWTGVRLSEVLALAEPTAEARVARFVSTEVPYIDTLTLEQAAEDDAMLAYGMDGKPLSREHGAPVRVVMPKMYGYKGVKWLERIDFIDRDEDGYWQQRGYDRDAWLDGAR